MRRTERFDLRISEEERARLRALATQASRSESDVVRFMIRHASTPIGGALAPIQIVPKETTTGPPVAA